MLTKVFGAIFMVVGFVIAAVNFFVYLNSSAHLDYNTGNKLSIAEAGNLYPFFIAAFLLIMGYLLARDHVLESDHH